MGFIVNKKTKTVPVSDFLNIDRVLGMQGDRRSAPAATGHVVQAP